MANDNQRSHKVKDDESIKSKKKMVTKDASPSSILGLSDTPSSRRSSRETSSRKQTKENLTNTRKSERLERRKPSATPPIKEKSERTQEQTIATPVKKVIRGKKHTSLGSLGSNKFVEEPASSNMKSKKEKVGRSLKQCAMDTSEDNGHEKHGLDVGGRKRKRAATRVNKALSKPQQMTAEAGDDNDKESKDKSSQANSSSNRDVDKELKRPGHVGCPSRKSCDGESIESGSEAPISGKGSSSKRGTSTRKTDSDTCANIKDNRISHRSPSSRCKRHGHDETCIACSKKQRKNHGLGRQQELNYCDTCTTDLHDTSSSKDRTTCEAAGLTEIVEKNNGVSRMGTTICIACKLGGKLRCCDAVGCNRFYHLSCLDPPVNHVPLGIWRCPFCVKNIKSSVPSVSGVAESIWDTREVEVSDAEGLQKQYFVKYKGLAHIHNQWVTETRLLHEAPLLVEIFSKNGSMKWTEAWTVPHQLLKKRLLLSFKPLYESLQNAGKVLNYHYEWLVKWQGLDYEQATWESENTSFLDSPEGHNLIKEYENHHGNTKISASPVDKIEELSFKLPTIPAGCPPGMDNIHLSYVKNLHDAWNKGQNGVVFDDQEWTMRIVLFILSLKGVTLPFLLITTSNSLPRWEAMFLRIAPCNDFKVSLEGTEGQRSSRLLEVQKEGGQLAFQVLLYPADAFVKDLNVLKAIKWEAVIVDESQSSEISTHVSHIKSLSTDKRLLVFCGPLGVSMTGYLDVLSLLDCDGALPSCVISKTELDDISKLKETLSRFIAYECKSSSSKFVEFWVPVQISTVQLEQYCSLLLSNAMALSSCSKSDTFGALHDLLVSNRKCCDHPYIVDQFLQGVLTKNIEAAKFLDVGIKASGKLQFLDLVLPEMRKRQLRVLILFQPLSSSGRDSTSIGDILDDFVRQRFGEDSYERVDGIGTIPSKKQAALNNFNNKDMGRFIFLLEYRACLPSIKLLSVDNIIIFDSDWNPANDLRALQKIAIDSQSEQIMIFRLYTSWTLEEKILRLAEHNVTIDSKLQNLSRRISDELLMWGATYLFNKLAEFHSASVLNASSEEYLWNELMEEFLNLISHKYKNKDTAKLIITRVQHSYGTYGKDLPLPSELITQLADGEQPHTFWRKLLEGRNPCWKYLSRSTPRQRKRPLYFEESPKKTNGSNDDVGRKRKKTANNIIEPAASKPVIEEGEIAGACTGASRVPSHDGSQSSPGDSLWCAAICDETSFRHLLKLNISKLCEILKFSEDVKIMVERFLEYVIENYRVNKEPANTLQAFLISLCWIGSALLKHKLDRRQSLALAKKHLNFSCKEEEANSVYLKLEPAKEKFLHHMENQKKPDVSKDSIPAAQATSTLSLDPRMSHSGPLNTQGVKVEILESPHNQYVDDEIILLEHGRSENHKWLNEETLLHSKQVPSECKKRKENLAEKKKKEMEKFNSEWDGKRVRLENEYKVDKAFICYLHNNPSVRSEKLKSLNNMFANKLEIHERQRGIHLKAMQLAVEGCMAAPSNSSASEGKAHNEQSLHGSEHENQMVFSGASEHDQDSPTKAPTLSRNLMEVESLDKSVHDMHPTLVVPSDILTRPNETVGGSVHSETILSHTDPNSASVTVNAMSFKLVGASIEDQPNRGGSANTGTNNVEEDGKVFEEVPGTRNKEQSKRSCTSSNSANSIKPTSFHTSVKQMVDVTVSSVPAEEIPGKKHEGAPNDVVKQVDSVGMEELAVDCNKEIAEAGTIIPDGSHYGEDQNDISPNEVEGHVGSVGMGVLAVDCNQKNAEGGTISLDASDALEDQNDPHSSNSNSPSAAASREKVLSVRPLVSPASGQSVPTNLEIQNESIQDNEVQGNPRSLTEISNLQTIDAGKDDQFTSEDSSLEPHEEPCFPVSANPAVAENQSNIPPASTLVLEITSDWQTLPCDSGVPNHPAEECDNPSDHTMLQSRVNMEEHPLVSAEMPLGEQQPDLHSADRVDWQPSCEPHNPSQNPEAPPQVLEITAEVPNQAATPPGPNLSNIQGSDNHNQGASWMPYHSPSSSDPLQSELEKLSELKDTVIKFHEAIKLKLKSDYEKELAETVAQMKHKYEAKRQDAETAFQLKKKQVDINLNRVVMNKILAEAFRSKCQDLGPSDPAGIKVTQSGGQLSPQRSTGVTSSSPAQSSGSQQVTKLHPPLQIVHQTAKLFSSIPSGPSANTNPSSMPTRPPPNINPITPSRRPPSNIVPISPTSTPSRPLPNINPITHSSRPSRPPPNINPITPLSMPSRPQPNINPITPLSMPSRPPPNINPITPLSMPSRPLPNINHTTPSARSLHVTGEIRAPAPHIRPFRPSTSVSPHDLASHRVMPSQHASSSLPLSSPTFSQASARPPLPLPLQPSPPLPINHNDHPTQNSPRSLLAASPLLAQASSQPPPASVPVAPPASFQLPSLYSSLPSKQHPLGSLPAMSLSLPQASPQISLPPIPSISISHTGLYSASGGPESGILLPTPDILSLPALDLLMDIDKQAGFHQRMILPYPPDFRSTNEFLDLTKLGKEGGANDLVCLSDDD